MTLEEALLRADEMRPNALSQSLKTGFINDVEGAVMTDVFLKKREFVPVYRYPADAGASLFIKPPHDKIYSLYLAAMIDYANKDFAEYHNDMTVYNAALDELKHFVACDIAPADNPDYDY